MSRAPPFPTRQNRSGSVSRNNVASPTPTRPLQISRPTTPSSDSVRANGPSRPQRSELRARNSDIDGNSNSTSSSATRTVRNTPKPERQQSEDDTTSPNLNNVLSAFQSAGRRRAMTNGSDDFEYQRMRDEERAAEMARQQQYQKRMPGRKGTARPRPGDIDAVLNQVMDGWEFVVDPDFNPVNLAVDLLDQKSTGKDMRSFQDTKYKLFNALKGSVDKYYQAFAASLPHHASLLNHLSETQDQIDGARSSLQESKDFLGNKRADLVQMWSRGQTLEEMMRLLDQIEHLKTVPDLLETLMSEKRLLQASVLLVRNLKIINKPDMQEIGAVSDLRSYLLGQETALREILVDELHSHLFLKSFWCDSRWASYTPNQRAFPKVEFEEEPTVALPDQSPSSPTFPTTRLARFLQDLTLRPNDAPMDANEPNAAVPTDKSLNYNISSRNPQALLNPEADSFVYLETVLESLAVLGRLGATLDIVAQRLPIEIYSLIETTIDEVSERAEYGRRSSVFGLSAPSLKECTFFPHKNGYLPESSLRLAALESSFQQVDQEILRDFFWTLYSKMDAVAQGLRVIYEVANRIGSRRDFKDSAGTKPGTLFPLVDIWLSIQVEMKTLIYDYLTNEDEGIMSGRNPISSINEILRDGRFSRDKTKSFFRFADTDAKLTAKILRPHEDELTQVLKDTMPGLVQGPADNTVQSSLSTGGSDERLLGADQHHRLLIKPNAFHVSVLFQPTLAFLERVHAVLPSDIESIRESGTVLDEFVLNIYLPQLEDKVSYLFHQAIGGPEAFQPDPLSKRISPEPLLKAGTHLMALINSLCAMLQTTPFHRESYSRLILGVIIQFYQRCSDKFQDLVSSSAPGDSTLEPQVALAAQWAQRTELVPCLTELQNTLEENIPQQQQLWRQETHLEQDFLGQRKITSADLVPSIRNLAYLAGMYRTITWFVSGLSTLKAHPEGGPLSPQNLEPLSALSMPYTPIIAYVPMASPSDKLTLVLSKEMSLRFQALLRTYQQLSELILHTIRVDVRCRTVHYLDLAMRGNYRLDGEAAEPDPHIIDLNNDLSECDDLISPSVPPYARQFIFSGLGQLMEHVLIHGARYLRRPNVYGVRKILRNILALQQSVKTITVNSNQNFDRAKRYFSLFFIKPEHMLQGIKQLQEFSFDDYQTMLALQCASQATDRDYGMYVIELHGLEIEQN
ncbi:Sec8 exocyst complex component-specific domain-containing protein [Rhodocollybia butyracea]|uniref:Exocyst complex component Sec8 n=1 Tax=Rhodocollybia butyracea TaxID=206335 RepID=A0A9P5UF90_9AGAR|nr:Sec8 exocyst complex component-specific domain-containing protein [Rhodocollybia butyracea]